MIKEIAAKDIAFCTKCNSEDNDKDCVACIEGGRALFAKDVLKIISECKVNNAR